MVLVRLFQSPSGVKLGFFPRGGGGGGGHTVSHPGYLPDCQVDIHAVFY